MDFKQYLIQLVDSRLPLEKNNEDLIDYLMAIEQNFSCCENMNVLEIGPFDGYHTEIIKKHNPKSITLVEPNTIEADLLKENYPECNVINEDIMIYLADKPYVKKKYDVVVCCGVLYHLHSPVFLLELIANQCDPEYLILETMDCKDNENINPLHLEVDFRIELDNTPGNRYTSKCFEKSVNLTLVAQLPFFEFAMERLGYDIIIQSKYYEMNIKQKSKEWSSMTVFKKRK